MKKKIKKQSKSLYCRSCKEVKVEGQNYCEIHWNQIQQLRKEKRTAQKIKKKKEMRMSRTAMLQRKQNGELFLWELTQKRFKKLNDQRTVVGKERRPIGSA